MVLTVAPTLINPRPDDGRPTLFPESRRRLRPQRQQTKVPTLFATAFDQRCHQSNAPTPSPTSSRRRSRLRLQPTEVPTLFATPFDQLCQKTNALTPIRPYPNANKPMLLPASQSHSCLWLQPTEVWMLFATPFDQPSLRPAESKPDQRPNAVRFCGANRLSFMTGATDRVLNAVRFQVYKLRPITPHGI